VQRRSVVGEKKAFSDQQKIKLVSCFPFLVIDGGQAKLGGILGSQVQLGNQIKNQIKPYIWLTIQNMGNI
jgi:hypothetical protein